MATIRDALKFKGDLYFKLVGPDGTVLLEREDKNRVVDVGLGHITSRLIGTAQAVVGWMEVGTANTNDNDTQTALGTPVAASRTALTSYTVTTSGAVANDQVTAVCTFGPGVGSGNLVEAGLFNAASSGVMLCRSVFGIITKASGDTLTITWKITAA